jgi:hypothetical protein
MQLDYLSRENGRPCLLIIGSYTICSIKNFGMLCSAKIHQFGLCYSRKPTQKLWVLTNTLNSQEIEMVFKL